MIFRYNPINPINRNDLINPINLIYPNYTINLNYPINLINPIWFSWFLLVEFDYHYYRFNWIFGYQLGALLTEFWRCCSSVTAHWWSIRPDINQKWNILKFTEIFQIQPEMASNLWQSCGGVLAVLQPTCGPSGLKLA